MSETLFGKGKPFKNDEKCFLFHLFSFSRYLNFCLEFLVKQTDGLIRKIRLISKFLTLQPGKQRVAIHILPNISRGKGNQAVKFGQLIECNMTCRISSLKYKQFAFIVCQVKGYRNILKLSCADHLLVPHIKLFQKTKGSLELVSLPHFLLDF